jgi:hypothetical protein
MEIPTIERMIDSAVALQNLKPSVSADNQLRLRYADKLMASRNPAMQAELRLQVTGADRTAADDAVDWVNGYKAAYANPTLLRTVPAYLDVFVAGMRQGVNDLRGQLMQDYNGAGVVGKRI